MKTDAFGCATSRLREGLGNPGPSLLGAGWLLERFVRADKVPTLLILLAGCLMLAQSNQEGS